MQACLVHATLKFHTDDQSRTVVVLKIFDKSKFAAVESLLKDFHPDQVHWTGSLVSSLDKLSFYHCQVLASLKGHGCSY